MSPHTDAGAFTIRLEARPADDSHDWVEIYPAQLQWMAKEGNQVRAIEVAASHGSAGTAQALEVTPAMLDAGAQALANDVWHPPQPLASLSNSDVMKYRRQALLVLKASLSLPSAEGQSHD